MDELPTDAPEPETSADELLSDARARLRRLTPQEAQVAMKGGALLIDIRAESQRDRDGEIPGAVVIPRNVLEWRLDPRGQHRDRALTRPGRMVILVCAEGYQSSLAAATLLRFGLRATDVVGGAQAWRSAGLPIGRDDRAQ